MNKPLSFSSHQNLFQNFAFHLNKCYNKTKYKPKGELLLKILLIGGTGTISTDITRLLLATGHEVTLLNRGSKPVPEGAGILLADIHNEAAVKQQLGNQTFDVVANFIAFTPSDVQRDIRLFSGVAGQYVFISSASAYQTPPAFLPITESTPLANPRWQYSRDKIAGEELLMQQYREAGFPVTIVRPSHTYNSEKVPVALHGAHGSWQVLHRMLQGKPVLMHGDGTSLWTLTHSTDFARGFVGLLGNVHAIGQAVHITSDESLSWNQIYEIIGRALGVQPNILCVPSSLLVAFGSTCGQDLEGTLLGDKSHSMVFDNAKLKRLVPGFAATVRFDEGGIAAARHMLATPDLQTPDPDFDRFCDKTVAAMQAAQNHFANS